jgi:hypothetical protein
MSTCGARTSVQYRTLFQRLQNRRQRWGGPPGPQPAPWPAFPFFCEEVHRLEKADGASAADQGVRPTKSMCHKSRTRWMA